MTKSIKLSKNKCALVDDEDFEYLNNFNWSLSSAGYAVSSSNKIMHRMIMNTPKGLVTDHINHNTLDNRKENLRICTNSENRHNYIKPKNNTSGYKGVYFHKTTNKWCAKIRVNRIKMHLGYFLDIEEAAIAYNKAATKYFGEFALLNYVEEKTIKNGFTYVPPYKEIE